MSAIFYEQNAYDVHWCDRRHSCNGIENAHQMERKETREPNLKEETNSWTFE